MPMLKTTCFPIDSMIRCSRWFKATHTQTKNNNSRKALKCTHATSTGTHRSDIKLATNQRQQSDLRVKNVSICLATKNVLAKLARISPEQNRATNYTPKKIYESIGDGGQFNNHYSMMLRFFCLNWPPHKSKTTKTATPGETINNTRAKKADSKS